VDVSYLVVLVCGFVYEAACVYWVYAAEQRKCLKIALWSMLCATVQLTGIIETVKDLWHAPVFILGYGLGSAFAVYLNRKAKDGN